MAARLKETYTNDIKKSLMDKYKYANVMKIPSLDKIVVNMGVGSAIAEKKHMENAVAALAQITGQKPLVTMSRKAIAGFRLREGMPIGCKVTLRGQRMYELLDRLISLAIPRVRDFRGLDPNGFDHNGNYSMGLSEQLVFPELNPDKFTRVQGMNITIVTSTRSDEEARQLLTMIGMPYRREEQAVGAA